MARVGQRAGFRCALQDDERLFASIEDRNAGECSSITHEPKNNHLIVKGGIETRAPDVVREKSKLRSNGSVLKRGVPDTQGTIAWTGRKV